MAKGVAGEVDTPFNRLFKQRAKKTGVIGVQARLLDGFRKAKAKVVYTFVTYQPGYPDAGRTPRCFARSSIVTACYRGLLRSIPSTTSPPGHDEPVVRGQACSAFVDTPLDTILRVAGLDTLVHVGIATNVAVESTAQCIRPAIQDDRRLRPVPGRQRRGSRPLA